MADVSIDEAAIMVEEDGGETSLSPLSKDVASIPEDDDLDDETAEPDSSEDEKEEDEHQPGIDAIVLCALPQELDVALSVFARAGAEDVERIADPIFRIPRVVGTLKCKSGLSMRILLASTASEGTGNRTNAAVAVSTLMVQYRPTVVVMTGICATVKPKLDPGDMVLCEEAMHVGGAQSYRIPEKLKERLVQLTRWMGTPYSDMQECITMHQAHGNHKTTRCSSRPPTWERQWKWLLRRIANEKQGEFELPSDVELQKYCPSWRSVCHYLESSSLVDIPDPKPGSPPLQNRHPLQTLSMAKLTVSGKHSLSSGKSRQARKTYHGIDGSDPRALCLVVFEGRVESGGWADPAIQSDDKLKPLQFAKNIRTNEQTSAVDLETSSFYACMSTHFPTANYFSIKGVCDFARNLDNEEFFVFAIQFSTAFALWFMKEEYGTEHLRSSKQVVEDFSFSTDDLLQCEMALASVDPPPHSGPIPEEESEEIGSPAITMADGSVIMDTFEADEDVTDDSYDEEDEAQYHFEDSSSDLRQRLMEAKSKESSESEDGREKRTKSAPPASLSALSPNKKETPSSPQDKKRPVSPRDKPVSPREAAKKKKRDGKREEKKRKEEGKKKRSKQPKESD